MQFLVEHNWSSPWHNARTTEELDGTLHQFSFYEISLLGDLNDTPGVDGIDHMIVPSNSLNFSTIEQYGGVFSSFLMRSLNLCQIAQCTLLEPGKLGMQSKELMCMGTQSKNRAEAGTEESAAP